MKKILSLIAIFTLQFNFSQVLDSSFGVNGILTDSFTTNISSESCGDAALQSDGKTVIVGRNYNDFNSFVTRINASGVVDPTFNNYGFKTFGGSGFDSVFIQPDGKILVLGQNKIYRLNSNGDLDLNFNSIGSNSISINTFSFYGKSMILQSDGKIILVGSVSNSLDNDYAVVRLNTDGTFDTTFDVDGKATFALGTAADEAFSVAIQSDGKIIVVGQTNNGSNYDFGTIRLNIDGSIDTSFAVNGKSILQFGAQDYGRTIDIQTDGKILIAGVANTKLAVVRYLSNGNLDTSFDSDGTLLTTITLSNSLVINAISLNKPKIKFISQTGQILISGQSNGDFCVIKLNSDGTFNTNFGTSSTGIISYNSNTFDASTFLLIKPDGKFLTGGSSYSNTTDFKISHLQYSSNGILEQPNTFSLTVGSDQIYKTIEQSSGKTLSITNSTGQPYSLMLRYNTNGTIDPTFGSLGTVNLSNYNIYKIIEQNNKIILTDQNIPRLLRFSSNGILDSTFGVNGVLDLSSNFTTVVGFIEEIYPLNNGKLLVGFAYDELIGGSTYNNFSYGLMLLNADGTIDTSFGINGIAKTRFNYFGADSNEFPSEIIIQSDNKIVVSGFLNTTVGALNRAIGITRFNTNGSIDNSFGINGNVVVDLGYKNFPQNLIGLSNDKLLINSSGIDSNNLPITLTIKLDSNGFFDTTFGTNGYLIDTIYSNDMLVQTDGKIIKAGYKDSHFAITRYNVDSTLDTSFGNSGLISTTINLNSSINSLLLLQNNKILVGGESFNGTRTFATQAKFINTSLGILDMNENSNSILIYPNPIETNANFEFTLANEENISIEIIDLQGKIVKTIIKNKVINAGNHIQNIDLNDNLASGNYILKFTASKGSQSIKIIKK